MIALIPHVVRAGAWAASYLVADKAIDKLDENAQRDDNLAEQGKSTTANLVKIAKYGAIAGGIYSIVKLVQVIRK